MKLLILTIACLLVTGLRAQEISVSEDEISFEILKWHYSNYPKNEANVWKVLKVDGTDFYRVNFKFEDRNYQAEYNENGDLTHEVIDMEDEVPVSITSELEVYEKYKIDTFQKISNMKEARVVYKLEVKVKSEGRKVHWYDENYIEMPNTDFTHFISNLN